MRIFFQSLNQHLRCFFGRWCLQRWRLLLPLKRAKWYLGPPGESRRTSFRLLEQNHGDFWSQNQHGELLMMVFRDFLNLEGCFFSQAWFCVSVDWNLPDLFALSIFFEIFHVWDKKMKEISKHGETVGRSPTRICRLLSLKSAAYATMELYHKVQWRPVWDKYHFFGFCSGW